MASDVTGSNKWEYTIVHTDRLNTPAGPQLAPIWRRKYADGTTDWDQINKLGEAGWEMVSAFPVEGGGTLQYVAFVFKRPKQPAPPPALEAPAKVASEPERAGAEPPAAEGEAAEPGTG